ncbi:uncharacterized protein BO87DRAFT_397523 [Aspergillus neoniger CBS 115656]|uniref:Uncharacterized protein n=1 Tax=Aspergillus neoniger (strain CBS 115656) TaxID=1448310 RepID=A0A318YH96_ASPNB|nr:hypothetical protein BO87DRAFT_397523 [Aspergillus neoniger CBS 115656]PYH33871.1 hypothetical protein BO87DRAFT_397523 [Aspergillus neoniger CBS 115656]
MLKLLICPLKPYSPKRLKTVCEALELRFEDETPNSETAYGLRTFEKVDRHENTPEFCGYRHTDLLLADKRPTLRQFLYSARNHSEQCTLTLAPESLGNIAGKRWIRGHGIPAFSVGRHIEYRLIPKPEVKETDQAGLLTNERWEDQHGDGAFATHSTKELTVVNRSRMDATSKLPRTFSSQAGRKMDLALVRPLFDRPELPISYPRQIAVQAEAECCPGGPGSDGCRKLEQCWTFLDGFRPDDQTQARCTESGPSLPLLEMRPFFFAAGQKGKPAEAAVIYGPIRSPSRTPWNPGTIAHSGLVATHLGSGRIQPSGESLSFQVVLNTT